jgi:putative pyruvate formate lyase activating enzyme
MDPAYLNAHRAGILQERIEQALSIIERCVLCPRECNVNRLQDERGVCRIGRYAAVSSYGPHFGEEDPLVGSRGSGTIFFARCSLCCVFCQNYAISHQGEGYEVRPPELAAIMLQLQGRGVHNINFVTPSHVIPQILEALPAALDAGLHIPLVYNSSGYDSVAALYLLDGIIDIYLPDLKFADAAAAERYCKAPDYPGKAQAALKEMHRQVGDLIVNEDGVAVRGLLVRHLVMPEDKAGTGRLMRFLADEVSQNTYVNIMDQYRPCGDASQFPELNRPITGAEYRKALQAAQAAGITRLDCRVRRHIVM